MNITKEHLDKMIELATRAHAKDTRKGTGEPYIVHPTRVAGMFRDEELFGKVLAYGHDVIEDHPEYTEEIVRTFPPEVVEGLMVLSKKDGEGYFAFITRVSRSRYTRVGTKAILVKMADLMDNLSDSPPGSRKDKYLFALSFLLDELVNGYELEEGIPLIENVYKMLRENR